MLGITGLKTYKTAELELKVPTYWKVTPSIPSVLTFTIPVENTDKVQCSGAFGTFELNPQSPHFRNLASIIAFGKDLCQRKMKMPIIKRLQIRDNPSISLRCDDEEIIYMPISNSKILEISIIGDSSNCNFDMLRSTIDRIKLRN